MRYLKHTFYVGFYLLKHNMATTLSLLGYAILISIWNITTYTSGVFIKHTAQESLFNVFSSNITLILLSIVSSILFLSDINDGSIAYIKMRPMSPIYHTLSKIFASWILVSVISTVIFLSDALLLGTFSLTSYIALLITTLNIIIISSFIGSLTSNIKASIFVMIAYSSLSTSLHNVLLQGEVASWLKSLSLIAPVYHAIPTIGIICIPIMLIRELHRNIRA